MSISQYARRLLTIAMGSIPAAQEIVATIDMALLGSAPFSDANAIVKNDADPTKKVRLDASGITHGATRVLTPPNADATLPGTNLSNVFTAHQAFGAGSAVDTSIIEPESTYSTTVNVTETKTDLASTDNVVGVSCELELNPSAPPTASVRGMTFQVESTAGNTRNFPELSGVQGRAAHAGTGTVSVMSGFALDIENLSSGNVSDANCLITSLYNADSGTITNACCANLFMGSDGTGTIVNGQVVNIALDNVASTSSITDGRGINVEVTNSGGGTFPVGRAGHFSCSGCDVNYAIDTPMGIVRHTSGVATEVIQQRVRHPSQSANMVENLASNGTTLLSGINAVGKYMLTTSAGAPADTPADGAIHLDTTNHRLYCRSGGAWKYAALT